MKNSNIFNICVLCSSLAVVILGLIVADRSSTIFWGMFMILNFFVFRQYLTDKSRQALKLVLLIFFIILGGYLAFITVARFGDRDYSTLSSIFSYVGQPFINFCNIWDNLNLDLMYGGKIVLTRVFPATCYFFGIEDGARYSELEIELMTGISVNGFKSILGFFLLDLGKPVLVIFMLLFSFFIYHGIRKNLCSYLRFDMIIKLLAFYLIGACGCIFYYYYTYNTTIMLFLMIYLGKRLYKVKK